MTEFLERGADSDDMLDDEEEQDVVAKVNYITSLCFGDIGRVHEPEDKEVLGSGLAPNEPDDREVIEIGDDDDVIDGQESEANTNNVLEGGEILANYNVLGSALDILLNQANHSSQMAPPASQTAIDGLLEEEIGGQCHICLKEYEKGDVIKIMPCRHKYHSECIKVWLSKTNTCPICRYELPTDNEHYEAYRRARRVSRQVAIHTENSHN